MVLAGVSAGAICWFEAGVTDSFRWTGWTASYRVELAGGEVVEAPLEPRRLA